MLQAIVEALKLRSLPGLFIDLGGPDGERFAVQYWTIGQAGVRVLHHNKKQKGEVFAKYCK